MDEVGEELLLVMSRSKWEDESLRMTGYRDQGLTKATPHLRKARPHPSKRLRHIGP